MISRAIIVSLIFSAVIYAVSIKQTAAQTISDADIQNIVDKMISYDQDYAHANVDFTIDYGNKTTYDSDQDVSANPLFSYVNESIFNRPTYQVFFALRNEFNPDIRVAEVNTTQKNATYRQLYANHNANRCIQCNVAIFAELQCD